MYNMWVQMTIMAWEFSAECNVAPCYAGAYDTAIYIYELRYVCSHATANNHCRCVYMDFNSLSKQQKDYKVALAEWQTPVSLRVNLDLRKRIIYDSHTVFTFQYIRHTITFFCVCWFSKGFVRIMTEYWSWNFGTCCLVYQTAGGQDYRR